MERLKWIICFQLSSLYVCTGQNKPFNPLLGETNQGSFSDGTRYYCEHTSHHPPISHYLLEGANNSFKMSGYYEFIGKKVPVQRVWDEFQGSFFAIPNVAAIVTALQEVYEETKAGKVDRGAVAAEMKRYDQTALYNASWKPLIKMMTARRRAPQPANRAERRAAKRGR